MNAITLKIKRMKLSDKILSSMTIGFFMLTAISLIVIRLNWEDYMYWLIK